jgi:hypothetical protein
MPAQPNAQSKHPSPCASTAIHMQLVPPRVLLHRQNGQEAALQHCPMGWDNHHPGRHHSPPTCRMSLCRPCCRCLSPTTPFSSSTAPLLLPGRLVLSREATQRAASGKDHSAHRLQMAPRPSDRQDSPPRKCPKAEHRGHYPRPLPAGTVTFVQFWKEPVTPVPVLSDLEILLCPISVETALAPGGIGTWLVPSAHEPTRNQQSCLGGLVMIWGPPSFSFCLFSGPVSLLFGTKVGVAPISSSLLLVHSTREPRDPPSTEHARSFGEEVPLRPPPRPPCSPG